MIAIVCYVLGGCLIGGGVKGLFDRPAKRRPIIDHTPVYAKSRRQEVKWL